LLALLPWRARSCAGWVRGVIYIGLTAAAYAIYATQHVQNM
jgi:hypothetical protein